jgi:hypothetical protein
MSDTGSTSSNPNPNPDEASKDASGAQPLENVLIALQKTFSRVSASSSNMPPENARSLIMGNVNFEMAVPLDAGADRLYYSPTGKVSLRLTGTIQQDVRPVPRSGENPSPKEASGSKEASSS